MLNKNGERELCYVVKIEEHFHIPSTCQEILDMAGGEASIYGGMREGIVFRNYDGTKSFKAVDNNFITKYH